MIGLPIGHHSEHDPQTASEMKDPGARLQKDAGWGSRRCATSFFMIAKARGPVCCAPRESLEAMGRGTWRESARNYLQDHGFVQQAQESLLKPQPGPGIGVRVEGLYGRRALGTGANRRFGEVKAATDNG